MDEKKILEEFKKKAEEVSKAEKPSLPPEREEPQTQEDRVGEEKQQEQEPLVSSQLETRLLQLQAENENLKAQIEEMNRRLAIISVQNASRGNPAITLPPDNGSSQANQDQNLSSEELLQLATKKQAEGQTRQQTGEGRQQTQQNQPMDPSQIQGQGQGFLSNPGVMFILGKLFDNFGPAVVEAIKRGGSSPPSANSSPPKEKEDITSAIMSQLTAWGQMMGGLQTLVANMQNNAITSVFQVIKDLPTEAKLALLGIKNVPKVPSLSQPKISPSKSGYIKE